MHMHKHRFSRSCLLANAYIHKYKCTLPHMHAGGLSCLCSLCAIEAEGGWSAVKPKMFTCALHPVNRLYATLDVPPEKISCSQSWFGNYPIGHVEVCQTCRSGHYGADLWCFFSDSIHRQMLFWWEYKHLWLYTSMFILWQRFSDICTSIFSLEQYFQKGSCTKDCLSYFRIKVLKYTHPPVN